MFGLENQKVSRYGCVELAFLLANSVLNLPIWKEIFVLMNTIIENAPMKLMFYLTMAVILIAATVQHKSFVTRYKSLRVQGESTRYKSFVHTTLHSIYPKIAQQIKNPFGLYY